MRLGAGGASTPRPRREREWHPVEVLGGQGKFGQRLVG